MTENTIYDPMYLANYIILYSNVKGYTITNLKLQKILYYLKARFLLEQNRTLFETLQKWGYGPVQPLIYAECKQYGASEIKASDIKTMLRNPKENEKSNCFGKYVKETFTVDMIDEMDQLIIEETIDSLKNWEPLDLMHETRTHEIWKKDKEKRSTLNLPTNYSDIEIKTFFEKNPDKQLWKNK